VVIGGLQQVRPRMVIRPDEVPMPSFANQESEKKESGVSGQESEKKK
jgi:hypothetical protein